MVLVQDDLQRLSQQTVKASTAYRLITTSYSKNGKKNKDNTFLLCIVELLNLTQRMETTN